MSVVVNAWQLIRTYYVGNKEYAPDKCCILPETINSALASATKRRSRYKSAKVYAIGVDYDKARDKFFSRITPFGHDKQVKLHYWDTEEEAFQEYKLFKESEIRILALRYRDKIPDRLFDALIKYEVRPYSPYEDLRFQRGKRYKTELNQ